MAQREPRLKQTKTGRITVRIESHYGAVILHWRTFSMFVQSEDDYGHMLPPDWQDGDRVKISDEYLEYFTNEDAEEQD